MDINRSGAARILRPTPKQRVRNDARQCLMNDPRPYLIVAARLFTACLLRYGISRWEMNRDWKCIGLDFTTKIPRRHHGDDLRRDALLTISRMCVALLAILSKAAKVISKL